MECGPPNFSRLNFLLSTRICEQSSVSAEISVERRSGTVTESVVVRMIAPEKTRKEIWSGVRVGDAGSGQTNFNERQELELQAE
jgi:hypothetical protein